MQELNLAILSARNLHTYLGTWSESKGHSRDYVDGAITETTDILKKIDTKDPRATIIAAEVVFGTAALISLIANINALEITTPTDGTVLQGIQGYIDIIKHWEPTTQGEGIIRTREAIRPLATLVFGGIASSVHFLNRRPTPASAPVTQN